MPTVGYAPCGRWPTVMNGHALRAVAATRLRMVTPCGRMPRLEKPAFELLRVPSS
ncbi:MAG: hypothetical protein J6X49_16190 [Victivallales bacterium]|nr:hypothetical protein [Victivallales bacterium]